MDLFSGLFNKFAAASILILAAFLSSCTATDIAEVTSVELDVRKKPPAKTTYTGRTAIVKKGDNLYSISFLAGFNYLDVAKWNGLDPDKPIHPGQVIRLYEPEVPPKQAKKLPTITVYDVDSDESTSSTAVPKTNVQPATKKSQSTPVVARSTNVQQSKPSKWIWPAPGPIVQRFSKSSNQNGIEIAGEIGEPIRAVENGRVVYSGSGLIGYGRLVILKHDDHFLSVYAHNSRVVVNEGDSVSRGQKIAEMGNTDANRVKLHFEIRLDGTPVDPLIYLPRKSG